jgi:CubicO group peptidase (beta-lactamase class C family)
MAGGFSAARLTRLRDLLARHVASGFVPGAVAVLARHGEVHVEAAGTLAFEGAGADRPFGPDTICRLGSMTKPLVGACVLTLVEDGTLRLDDPVGELLPELADPVVLADPAGPLTDTVPADRPITVRDLLTSTAGTGMVLDEVPIADAIGAAYRMAPPDEWIARLGALPLVHQPGERWLYDMPANITGVLVARATGTTFGAALRERVFEPLGMTDTGFSVPAADLDRLATAYQPEGPGVEDGPDGRWSRPPVFESGGGGLVSTAADFLAFASALLAGGAHDGGRWLSRAAVALMTTDHLTPAQKATSGFGPGYFDAMGWGLNVSVTTRRTQLGPSVGSYGWPGFYGTAWYNDPAEDLAALLFLQRAHAGDQALPRSRDFWTAVYQALDD